ncbi:MULTISPECIES: hypothetical protein [Vibrio]|uniref:Uncharacterized protein n=3 Tax=Vibrio TaxID=662 RepID=A0AAN0SJP2_9VIBR|nr:MULTISPECIES: hypothetical protein [Vibrio]AIW22380.1 hypothetical protein IX92_25250 [Vibrio coralliilyticus]KIF53310.1 hypothetical protein H735_10325 [Vibrio owensii CAIM 1854 = LMG 25443]MCZ2799034.1 hypothetical protein [Vibrio alginolyticus]NOH36934.1 hypothetical protein [Vibrio coralliilyticus]POB47194.1 hypothetical protein CRN52_14030 [Vibrio vulnificus]
MNKLFISILLTVSASSAVATEGKDNYTIPVAELKMAEQKFNVAQFGQQVAVMALSYVKDIRDADGKKVVDVVIVDKLCHVTVIEHDNGLQAEQVVCDSGNYFDDREK